MVTNLEHTCHVGGRGFKSHQRRHLQAHEITLHGLHHFARHPPRVAYGPDARGRNSSSRACVGFRFDDYGERAAA